MSVAGRTALVSGGGSGLGLAIARALADAGARVVIVGRSLDTLAAASELLALDGADVRHARCDVGDPASVEALGRELADESISILVNNAGIPGPVKPLIETSAEDWDEVLRTNVTGVALMCQQFLPAMIEAGDGDVINLASVSGKRPLRNRTPYCASKMAVIGLTTTLAVEVGPSGVRVNSLSPGPVNGPRMDRNFRLEAQRSGVSEDEARAEFAGRAAMNRLLEEREVADAVVAMLAMTGLSGADIDLSAGMVAR
ncbi:MAG: SDR family oxidoreductase [Actinomycetota bacterium]|nr:SDR family oxidoreductase [Actinomycetota bacterium]